MSTPSSFSSNSTSSLRSRLLRQLRLGDYMIAALFLALAVASLALRHFGQAEENADIGQVLVQNNVVAELSLQKADTVMVQGTLGAVQLAISNGAICVLASSCPLQVCVQQGRIQRAGQIIICAPNHLVVVLLGKKENGLDAITY